MCRDRATNSCVSWHRAALAHVSCNSRTRASNHITPCENAPRVRHPLSTSQHVTSTKPQPTSPPHTPHRRTCVGDMIQPPRPAPSSAAARAAVSAWASAIAATSALSSSADASSHAALRALTDVATAAQRALGELEHSPTEFETNIERALADALGTLSPHEALLAPATSTRHSSGSAVTLEECEEDAAPPPLPPLAHVVALFSFSSTAPNEISMRQGDLVEVLCTHASGWWSGRARNGHTGFFPSNYTRPLSQSEQSRMLRKRVNRRTRRIDSRGASRSSSALASPAVSRAASPRSTPVPPTPVRGTRPHDVRSPTSRLSAECV